MIGIISVTEKGNILAEKIQCELGGDLYLKSKDKKFSLDNITSICFEKYKYVIFISSTGIAVRAIAKYLKGKDKDPGVVVVDVCNNFSISLVSGHLGGANELARKVSTVLNNTVVITTATDNLNKEAPDIIAINNNLLIEDLKFAKDIASRLVNDEEVYFKDDINKINLPNGYIATDKLRENTLWITNKLEEQAKVLKLIRRNVILGIGCRKNTEGEKLKKFIFDTLKENNISEKAIRYIASIDVKKDEEAILSLTKEVKCEFKVFSKEEILKIEDKYEGSSFVKKQVGVKCVCEPVIELLGGNLIVKKIKNNGMTLAIGELV
ncbi:cobalt-precorrin 5A hydrolase [Clostridium carnis]